jgi:hypothetical protein
MSFIIYIYIYIYISAFTSCPLFKGALQKMKATVAFIRDMLGNCERMLSRFTPFFVYKVQKAKFDSYLSMSCIVLQPLDRL